MLLVACIGFAGSAVPLYAADTHDLAIETKTAVHTFTVEVMRTPAARARGLMHRRQLDRDAGMLFDFEGNVTARMWMKNTFIPLDMIFIRSDGTITNIAANTVPHSMEVLSSEGPVRYVLEINAGLSQEFGISAGDSVRLPLPTPQ